MNAQVGIALTLAGLVFGVAAEVAYLTHATQRDRVAYRRWNRLVWASCGVVIVGCVYAGAVLAMRLAA